MKKILVASTALLLVAGAAATSAIAAEDQAGVKISGDARARLVFKGSYDFGNTDASDVTFMDSRVRITVKGTAAGGAYAVGRIRLMDNKGEDNDTDSASGVVDPGNVWIDKAYIGVPFSDAFTIEAGKYRVSYGTGFFYDDINLAGFRGIVKVGNVEINPFVEWMAEGQNSKISIDKLKDNDSVRMGANITAKINENWKVGLLAGYQTDNRAENFNIDVDGVDTNYTVEKSDGAFADVYFSGKQNAFGINGEFVYTESGLNGMTYQSDDHHYTGTDGIGSEDDGWGGYIMPTYTIDALTLGLNMGFTGGGFLADLNAGFILIGGDDPITIINVGDAGDWLWAGFVAKYAISDSLNLTGNIVYASINADGTKGKSSISDAMEISGALQYTISKGADFYWYAGCFIPSFDDPAYSDDPAFGSYGKLEVKF
jgi:hypothetical protein